MFDQVNDCPYLTLGSKVTTMRHVNPAEMEPGGLNLTDTKYFKLSVTPVNLQ